MPHPPIRRVVTGHDAEGHDRVVEDSAVEPITSALLPGAAFYRLWGSDERPVVGGDGAPPDAPGWFPPPDGSRFMVNTFPPDVEMVAPAGVDEAAALAELDDEMPGAMDVMDPDEPGMHATDSVDYVVVVAGEATLELSGGDTRVLRAGDVVVQNGTRHAWRNAGDEPCTIVGIAIGADRG